MKGRLLEAESWLTQACLFRAHQVQVKLVSSVNAALRPVLPYNVKIQVEDAHVDCGGGEQERRTPEQSLC